MGTYTRQPLAQINVPTRELVEKVILYGHAGVPHEALRLVARAQPGRLGGVECRAEPGIGDEPIINELARADHDPALRPYKRRRLSTCHCQRIRTGLGKRARDAE